MPFFTGIEDTSEKWFAWRPVFDWHNQGCIIWLRFCTRITNNNCDHARYGGPYRYTVDSEPYIGKKKAHYSDSR